MSLARFPLRTQLTALLLALLGLVLLATSLAATVVMRGYLVDRVDAQLATAIREPGGPQPPPPRRGRAEAVPSGVVLVRFDPSGQRVRQEGLPAGDPSGPDLTGWPAREAGAATVDAEDGSRRWRVLSRQAAGGATVLVAAPLETVDDTVARLVRINALLGLLALGVGGVLAWLAVRRSLRGRRPDQPPADGGPAYGGGEPVGLVQRDGRPLRERLLGAAAVRGRRTGVGGAHAALRRRREP